MGKTVGTILKVAGAVALSVATFNPGFLSLVGLTTGSLAIAGAVSTLAGSLLDPPKVAGSIVSDQGRLLSLQTDPTSPRYILYGKAATGGVLLYREATGTNNEDLHLVIGLAGHKLTSFDGFKFGGEAVSFDTGGNAQGNFSGHMKLQFHDGDEAQLANQTLVAASAKWSAAHKLSGIAYAYLRLTWDHDVFPQGLEKTLFNLKGRRLYDPRQDPSKGGNPQGTQSLLDENSWVWSDNPVLAITDYLMGVKVGGQTIAGMGISPNRIDWDNIIAEANVCDELVALKAGGTEKRYTLNGWVDPNQSHRNNIKALSSACGGNVVFQSGYWRCFVAQSRPAIKTRSSNDVIGPISMQAKKSVSEKINSIRGVYSDPLSDYELKDFTPLQNQTFIAQDGGHELWSDLNLPFTKSSSMAQRLAKIALGKARMEKIVKASFSLASLQDQAMDSLSFSHERFNLSNQNMTCADWRLAVTHNKEGIEGLCVECVLVEDCSEIYAWSPAMDEVTEVAVDQVTTSKRKYLDHGKIPGFVDYIAQINGVGKPVPYADITSQNTSQDTSFVGGALAVNVRDYAQTGYDLTQNNATKIDPSSLPVGFDLLGDDLLLTGSNAYNRNLRMTYGASLPNNYFDFGYYNAGNKVGLAVVEGGFSKLVQTWDYNGNSEFLGALKTNSLAPYSGSQIFTTAHFELGNYEMRGASKYLFNSGRGLTDITGEYGTIQTIGSGVNGWGGFSINGRLAFMEDGAGVGGIFNDTNNQWVVRTTFLGGTQIYYNGYDILTTTAIGITVSGTVSASTEVTVTSDPTTKIKRGLVQPQTGVFDVIFAHHYERKSDGLPSIGFMTDEVKRFYPSLVRVDENGIESLNYNGVLAALWCEVASLRKELGLGT